MNKKQSTLGVLVIVIGISLFLANANIGGMREVVGHWWPLFIVALGVYMLWSNRQNYVWALFTVLVGVSLLLNALKIADISLGVIIVPMLLVGFGLNVLLSGSRQPTRDTGSSEENIAAVLSGSTSKHVTNDYTGGSVSAVMGGVELDLSKAVIKKEATLHVNVFMGGVELRVADDVIVKNRTAALLGGVEDKTFPEKTKKSSVLNIDGNIVMGGVEVKR